MSVPSTDGRETPAAVNSAPKPTSNGITRKAWWPLLLVSFAALAFLAEVFLLLPMEYATQTKAALVVKARISSGSSLEVFVNNDWNSPLRAQIVPEMLHAYTFTEIPRKIDVIRLDPSDREGVSIQFESIELQQDGETVKRFSAKDLSAWGKDGLSSMELAPDETLLSFRSSTNDPLIIAGELGMALPSVSLMDTFSSQATAFTALLLLLPIVLSRASLRFLIPAGLFLTAASYFGRPVVEYYSSLGLSAPPVNFALGYAAYIGHSKTAERLSVVTTLALSILSAGLLGLILRKRGFESPKLPQKRFSWTFIFTSFVLFAVFMFPPLAALQKSIPGTLHTGSGFDWGNVFVWDFLAHYGFLPYRDFWFPYAGDINQLNGLPASAWEIYQVQLILFTGLLICIYELSGRRMIGTLLLLFSIGIGIQGGLLHATKRYLPTLISVMAGALLVFRLPRIAFPYACFGVFIGWMFWRDPPQLGYAAIGIAPLITLGWLRARGIGRGHEWLKGLVIAGLFSVVLVAIEILCLALRGQWQGFVAFHERLPMMAASVSIPAAVESWYELTPRFENVLFLSMHVFAALGIFWWWRARTVEERDSGLLLLAVTLSAFALFQKMLLRPHMAQQILAFPFVLLGICLLRLSSEWKSYQRLAACCLIGLAFGRLQEPLVTEAMNFQARMKSWPEDVELIENGMDLNRETLDRYYAPESFKGLDPDLVSVVSYLNTQNLTRFSKEVFVLGDDSVLYALLKIKPCPYVSFYDGANIWAQREQASCLKESAARFIVWDSSQRMFDQVPNLLRVPLLFEAVIQTYLPEKQLGRYQILRPRKAEEPVAWNFWSEQLGSTLALGALPELSSADTLNACTEGEHCLDYLRIKQPATQGTVDIEAGGKVFHLSWSLTKEPTEVFLPLNRLWFWSVAKAEGLNPRLVVPSELQEVVKRETPRDLLY